MPLLHAVNFCLLPLVVCFVLFLHLAFYPLSTAPLVVGNGCQSLNLVLVEVSTYWGFAVT